MLSFQLILAVILALGAAVRGNWSPCGESLQAQIHPLGERSRGNLWGVTISAFTIGSVGAAAALAAGFGWAGSLVLSSLTVETRLLLTAVLALAAGALDIADIRPLTPRRQVNENWIGRYRGWVYGVAFGVQLGVGFAVFVMSWGYYAMLLAAALTVSPTAGALIGTAFGLGRGILLFLSGRIHTAEQLKRFHISMARVKAPVFNATGAAMIATGVLAVLVLI